MNYRNLGRTALKVSELCLGTMNFGPRTGAAESFQILDRAVDAGINFIDTANQYGGNLGVGTTETLLGEWLAKNPDKRDKLVLATKVHEPMSDDVNDRGLSARHISQACDASLKRLGVEHIELYQMHHIDRSAPVEEFWLAMERLIAQGKITYVGTSNFPGWAIARASEKAFARHGLGLVAEQSLYNLIERRAELEVIPACQAYGLGVIVWSPLAGGLLAGPPSGPSGDGRRGSTDMAAQIESRRTQLADYAALCSELNESPSNVALAWLLHQPGITATIIGPGTREQFESSLTVPEIKLTQSTLDRLDNIFPPCGAAPEAYAW
ncbi:MAG: aldo/keto reductase [Pseudomonadota bacterium]